MHYERFRDHSYLGAWDFEDGDVTVTIDRVVQGHVDRERPGEPPERVPLMYFRELERPLILNSTNGSVIKMLYGTADTRDWAGKRITLTTGLTTNKQGQPCLGIRVHMMKPEPATPAAPAPGEVDELAKLRAELAAARAAAGPALLAPTSRIVDVQIEEVASGKA